MAPPLTIVVSYLTLTVGDKGIKCLSVSPRRCGKGPSGAPPFATMAILSAPACHHMPLAAQPPATYARNGPRAKRWWVSWSAGCGVVACRGCCLVASGSLLLTGSCRDAQRVAASFSRCLGWSSRQAPLDGVLSPSRQAALAGALDTLFLNGSKGTTEDLGGHPASLAAGRCDCPCTR